MDFYQKRELIILEAAEFGDQNAFDHFRIDDEQFRLRALKIANERLFSAELSVGEKGQMSINFLHKI